MGLREKDEVRISSREDILCEHITIDEIGRREGEEGAIRAWLPHLGMILLSPASGLANHSAQTRRNGAPAFGNFRPRLTNRRIQPSYYYFSLCCWFSLSWIHIDLWIAVSI